MVSAVMFDFDYTLGDGTEGIVGGFCYSFEKMGLPIPEREAIRRTIGMTLNEAFAVLAGQTERTEEFRALYREKTSEILLPNTTLFPDVIPVFKKLKEKGIKTGIVTNKNETRMRETMDYFDFAQLVDVVVGGDTTDAAKPDPRPLQFAAERLGIDPKQALYVGDSVIDAQTAQAAGVYFAAVTTGTTAPAGFEGYPHLFTVPTLTSVAERLGMPLDRAV